MVFSEKNFNRKINIANKQLNKNVDKNEVKLNNLNENKREIKNEASFDNLDKIKKRSIYHRYFKFLNDKKQELLKQKKSFAVSDDLIKEFLNLESQKQGQENFNTENVFKNFIENITDYKDIYKSILKENYITELFTDKETRNEYNLKTFFETFNLNGSSLNHPEKCISFLMENLSKNEIEKVKEKWKFDDRNKYDSVYNLFELIQKIKEEEKNNQEYGIILTDKDKKAIGYSMSINKNKLSMINKNENKDNNEESTEEIDKKTLFEALGQKFKVGNLFKNQDKTEINNHNINNNNKQKENFNKQSQLNNNKNKKDESNNNTSEITEKSIQNAILKEKEKEIKEQIENIKKAWIEIYEKINLDKELLKSINEDYEGYKTEWLNIKKKDLPDKFEVSFDDTSIEKANESLKYIEKFKKRREKINKIEKVINNLIYNHKTGILKSKITSKNLWKDFSWLFNEENKHKIHINHFLKNEKLDKLFEIVEEIEKENKITNNNNNNKINVNNSNNSNNINNNKQSQLNNNNENNFNKNNTNLKNESEKKDNLNNQNINTENKNKNKNEHEKKSKEFKEDIKNIINNITSQDLVDVLGSYSWTEKHSKIDSDNVTNMFKSFHKFSKHGGSKIGVIDIEDLNQFSFLQKGYNFKLLKDVVFNLCYKVTNKKEYYKERSEMIKECEKFIEKYGNKLNKNETKGNKNVVNENKKVENEN